MLAGVIHNYFWSHVMLIFLTLLAAIISAMFVASVISAVTESQKEDALMREALARSKAF